MAPRATLTGAYRGSFYARDVGTADERLVEGRDDWAAWSAAGLEGEHLHYWEALTEAELDQRFGYLKSCGWHLLHISQHWAHWEKLDVGGRISPHGAEQLARYLRVAARHDLSVVQALSHYPYGITEMFDGFGDDAGDVSWPIGTAPVSRYVEHGFVDSDWNNPDSSFTELWHRYLADYAQLFSDETAIFAMTCSGEGDILSNPARVNATYRFMREADPNHLFFVEAVMFFDKLPEDHLEPFDARPGGGRTYLIGEAIHPEIDLGIEFKLFQLGGMYMAEGSWATPKRYALLHHELGDSLGCADTWTGTQRYRLRIRDSVYLGLVHRLPIIMMWDEHSVEEERTVFDQVRRQVDWDVEWRVSPAIRIDESNVAGDGRKNLARFEEFFARQAIPYRLVTNDDDVIGDAREPFVEPDVDPSASPIQVSGGWSASYTWSVDGSTLIAYVINSTEHIEHAQPLAGRWHRAPREIDLRLQVRHLPDRPLVVRVFDLETQSEVATRSVRGEFDVSFDSTHHDYLVLVRP